MRNIPKFLLLTAALSCLTILPGKESSAQDAFLPNTMTKESTTSLDNSLRGASFNEEASFAKYEKNILQDDTYTLKISDIEEGCDVSFKSSDTDVLTVKQLSNTSCSYTGVGYGKAKIKVTITKTTAFIFKEKKSMSATISVTPRAVSIMFRQSAKKVTIGKRLNLPLTIRPSISEEVPVFESLNSKIATISKTGKVTGKKLGKTYVTATISNGQKATCKITVVEASDDDKDNNSKADE